MEASRGLCVRIVECESRGCNVKARNVSILEAATNKILLMDADDLASPTYVASMSAALDRTPLVTGVWSLARLNGDIFPGLPDYDPASPDAWPLRYKGWAYAPTGTLGMRREVPERIGGFRPDLLWRATMSGASARRPPASTSRWCTMPSCTIG